MPSFTSPYTTELAKLVAGRDFSFYSFVGLQRRANLRELHVESHLYDEEHALALVSTAQTVLAIHGERTGNDRFVMLGGRHKGLRDAVAAVAVDCRISLRAASAGLQGTDANNICNRGRLRAGVQIEASRGLRDALQAETDLRRDFVAGLRSVLVAFAHGTARRSRPCTLPARAARPD